MKVGGGYDHNWILDRKSAAGLAKVAEVYDPKSGRVLDIESTEPAVQFYSGNNLKGTTTGKGGKVYKHRSAFCMEPQHYPDSPNKSNFPNVVLKPGETYHNTIVYKFGNQ